MQDANLRHYSGYTEEQLKPTAQLMLDYVARNSSLGPQSGKADDENPLKLESTESEHEHPNFVKKYSAKKVRKYTVPVRMTKLTSLNSSTRRSALSGNGSRKSTHRSNAGRKKRERSSSARSRSSYDLN